MNSTKKILFSQGFGLNDPGGGAKIIRTLLQNAPFEVHSISNFVVKPKEMNWAKQSWVPYRPTFGRLETSRFRPYLLLADSFFQKQWARKVGKILDEEKYDAIHVIPQHEFDWYYLAKEADKRGIPVLVSYHDDFGYYRNKVGEPLYGNDQMKWLWEMAAGRFVISEAMGLEYCARYSEKSYHVITDGLEVENLHFRPQQESSKLKIYFEGTLHLGYQKNFEVLFEALRLIAVKHEKKPEITFKGLEKLPNVLSVPPELKTQFLPYTPMMTSTEVQEAYDYLYFPLSFEKSYHFFNSFSFSTKAINYIKLGSPIFYHGPDRSAAGTFFAERKAVVNSNTKDAEDLANTIMLERIHGKSIVNNSIEVAKKHFQINQIRNTFFQQIDNIIN